VGSSGVTRGGIACTPGVRQLPGSTYSAPCVAAFTGTNGGETAPGVTADAIRVVRRSFPESANSKAVDAVIEQAGGADKTVIAQLRNELIPYFEQYYELYGRHVEWIDYESRYGNSTSEAQGKGREGACLDAEVVANELHAFAVVNYDGAVSKPFAECVAQRGVLVIDGAAYASEHFYASYHPLIWAFAMDCERIVRQVSEYALKRLAFRPATWAGDNKFRGQTRVFGEYTPVGDDDPTCADLTQQELEGSGVHVASIYRYTLDVSRFPDEAARGVIQFKRDGITTLILACDPISVIFLTQSATSQGWFPEWFIIGVALTDVDNAARLYDQQQVAGHLFGMSQLGATPKIIGPGSEPGRVYKAATGKEIVAGTDARYFQLITVYNFLQSAGPDLTPASVAAGVYGLPPGGGPAYAAGYVSYHDAPDGTLGGGDHTAIDDSREVYWVTNARSPADGRAGAYVETYAGRRFRNGEWPAESPPVYP
jgi:hypothetical protein